MCVGVHVCVGVCSVSQLVQQDIAMYMKLVSSYIHTRSVGHATRPGTLMRLDVGKRLRQSRHKNSGFKR